MPAQPDFVSATHPAPPSAESMNGPTGVAVSIDGFRCVSDTGNKRVLLFFPTNYDHFWADEEVYYDPDKYNIEATQPVHQEEAVAHHRTAAFRRQYRILSRSV